MKLDGTIISDCSEQSVRCEVNTEGDAKNAELVPLLLILCSLFLILLDPIALAVK